MAKIAEELELELESVFRKMEWSWAELEWTLRNMEGSCVELERHYRGVGVGVGVGF